MYENGYLEMPAAVDYPCIRLTDIYPISNLYIKSMYTTFKSEWAYTSSEFTFGVLAELVVGFIYGALAAVMVGADALSHRTCHSLC